MKKSLWQKLKKPIYCLAPMEGVTDTVFRRIVAGVGKPDVFFTEFTSVDGLNSRGFDYVKRRLEYTELERPIVAQIWGIEPDNFYKGAELMVKMGFDGVDINMGCPDRAVIKAGSGSALVKNKPLAGKIIEATKAGVDGAIPVSVKIRIGFDKPETKEWVKYILKQGVDALTVHGRTTKELSKVPADWEEIGKAVKVRDEMRVKTLVIGNGDVKNLDDADEKVEEYGVDGVMIGRAIFQNPWLFNREINHEEIAKVEKLILLREHVDLFDGYWKGERPIHVMRKFVKVYVEGFWEAKKLRDRFMEADEYEEFRKILDQELTDK